MESFLEISQFAFTNGEIELDLSWSKDCIIPEILNNAEVPTNPATNLLIAHVSERFTTGATCQISSTRLYVPVVAFSINNNIKFLENIKQGFKRISCNKYRSERTTQPKNGNLNCMIDPTFRNINWVFVLSFNSADNDPTRDSFDEYDMPLVEIKDFNALIDKKPFFD